VAAVPVASTQPKSAQRAPAAEPGSDSVEEGEAWDQLSADTDEVAARADTPGKRDRKSSATRRVESARPRADQDRRRIIIVVAVVSAIVLGGLLALLLWAVLHDATPPASTVPDKPTNRRTLHIGTDQEFHFVTEAFKKAVHGDRILVHGPTHEERLSFLSPTVKNLTIEAEEPVTWTVAKEKDGKDQPFVISLSGVDGWTVRGFTIDCTNASRAFLLQNRCPGLTLEALTLRGITTHDEGRQPGTGLSITNCDGDDRPVKIINVKATTTIANDMVSAIDFVGTGKPSKHIIFENFTAEGFKNSVLSRGNTEDVKGLP